MDLNPDVLPFDVSKIVQRLSKHANLELRESSAKQQRDDRHFALLRQDRGRRERRDPGGGDEVAAFHSKTSSARSNTVCGIVRPSALAVCRLMTSSKRVDFMTGKSAGAAPFKMRPA